jgi:glycosyltransferase involved in cell wall biosynthesis
MKLVIGIPAYNEEANIASVILKLQEISDSIIVCNDGSSDLTGKISEKLGVNVVNHKKNLGYGAAIKSIFEKAREINADILVTFDADGQHRIQDIETVMKPIVNNEADIVIGSRFLDKDDENVPEYRKIGIKVITSLTNSSLNTKLSDSQSGFRAYNRKALEKINPSEYGMGVSTEILIKSSKENFKIVEVPIKILYEGDTSTHNPVSHGLSVVMSTLKFISIDHPLKFYGIPGIIFLGIGLFFTVWTIQTFGETRQVITNIALIGVSSIILSTILMMTAVILYSVVNVVREKRT